MEYQLIINNGSARYFTDDKVAAKYMGLIKGPKRFKRFSSLESMHEFLSDDFSGMQLLKGSLAELKKEVVKPKKPVKKVAPKKKATSPKLDLLTISNTYLAISELWDINPNTGDEIIIWRKKMKLCNQILSTLFINGLKA